jgi:hypothetical protein
MAQNAETKKEEFQKYLDNTGVVDALTKVLVGLYEVPERPGNGAFPPLFNAFVTLPRRRAVVTSSLHLYTHGHVHVDALSHTHPDTCNDTDFDDDVGVVGVGPTEPQMITPHNGQFHLPRTLTLSTHCSLCSH